MMKKLYYQRMAALAILLVCLLAIKNFSGKENPDFSGVHFIKTDAAPLLSAPFDPNALDADGWKNLGFSEKQTATILKYREIVGGKFQSKEQLKKCYAISEEKFKELERFMILEETSSSTFSFAGTSAKHSSSLKIPGKFHPDQLSQHDWENMGYSEKQAAAILKYKNYLGGSFLSKEKLKECFIISEKQFQQMEPFVLLPETAKSTFPKYEKKIQTVKIQNVFDPNALDLSGWMNLGFSEKQATVILNYKQRNLRGSFKTLKDIQNCFVISAEKFAALKPFVRFNPATISSSPTEKKVETKPAATDFTKIDLNEITFRQLLEFGLDEKSAGSIIGFRRKLGGFMNKNQILETYNIDKEMVQKLLAIAPISTASVQRYSLKNAPEDWLKNHPYFKYSADKIIFLRGNEENNEQLLKLLRQKPIYEERMRLYLK